MFEVLLSFTGIVFAVWALIPSAAQERVRANVVNRSRWLWTLGGGALAVVLLWPFVNSLIPPPCVRARELVAAAGPVILIVLLGFGTWQVWPAGGWNEEQLRRFRTRLESLVLTGRPDVVVAVLAQALPRLAPRGLQVPREMLDDRPDTYIRLFDDILRDALTYPPFIAAAAQHDRRFVADLLATQSDAALMDSDKILHELTFGSGRVIPFEIAQSTNFGQDPRHHYGIPNRCVILHALFDNIEVARQTGCWKPIGDGVIRHVLAMGGRADTDPEQRQIVDESQREPDSSVLGMGIYFFRIMCTSAVKQGSNDHMWIMYLRYFVEAVIKIVQVPDAGRDDEYPNLYCYWIYDCISCCKDVAGMVQSLPEGNPNRPTGNEGDRNSVVAWALAAYGMCLAKVLRADNLPARFKSYMTQTLCLAYSEWRSNRFPREMTTFAVQQIKQQLLEADLTSLIRSVEGVIQNDPHDDAYRELLEALRRPVVIR